MLWFCSVTRCHSVSKSFPMYRYSFREIDISFCIDYLSYTLSRSLIRHMRSNLRWQLESLFQLHASRATGFESSSERIYFGRVGSIYTPAIILKMNCGVWLEIKKRKKEKKTRKERIIIIAKESGLHSSQSCVQAHWLFKHSTHRESALTGSVHRFTPRFSPHADDKFLWHCFPSNE